MAKVRAVSASPEIEQLLRQEFTDMVALKVDKTPGFLVNSRPLEVFGDEQLKTLVKEEIHLAYPK